MYFNRTDEFDSIEAATYALRVTADKIHVRLCGEDIAVLDPRSSVNTVGKGDDTNKDGGKGGAFTRPKVRKRTVMCTPGLHPAVCGRRKNMY